MAIQMVRVRKSFKRVARRSSRRRTPLAKRFLGENGQEWIDINLDNEFTTVDNVASSWAPLLEGQEFDNTALDGVTKTVRVKRIFGMLRGFGVYDTDLGPYADYDVAIVIASAAALAGTPNVSASQLADLVREPSAAAGQDFRVLQHKRVTVANQAILLPASDGGDPAQYEALVPASVEDRWNFDFDNGIHLNTEQTLYIVASQCESELYTNGMSSIFQGYVRMFVQLK